MSQHTRNGVIHEHGDSATITFVRRLNHPIEAVWHAITAPEERAVWFGPTTIDAREGGMVETLAEGPPAPPEMRRVTGVIRVWDPPRVFEHEANQTVVGNTIVRYELTPDGDGTIVRLTHTGLSARNARGYAPGQHAYFDRLEAHLDRTPLPGWPERYAAVQNDYPAM